MDKTEYQEKLNKLQDYLRIKDYESALKLVEGVDWRRVKSVRTLNMVADVYEVSKSYEKCRNILTLALGHSTIGKNILYRLTEVCIKERDLKAAQDYYRQYCKLAPRDNGKLLLEYKLAKATKKPLDEQIRLLEEYKDREYTEKWAYELARLYSKAGQDDKCVDVCDDMILWFSEGKYVLKAMELKQQYKPLTSSQQAYYDKEQRDSDESALYKSESETLAGYDAPKKNGSVIDRISKAGAEATKDMESINTDNIPMNAEASNISVTSPEFMGVRPDLKTQLDKSIESIENENVESGGEFDETAALESIQENIEKQMNSTDEGEEQTEGVPAAEEQIASEPEIAVAEVAVAEEITAEPEVTAVEEVVAEPEVAAVGEAAAEPAVADAGDETIDNVAGGVAAGIAVAAAVGAVQSGAAKESLSEEELILDAFKKEVRGGDLKETSTKEKAPSQIVWDDREIPDPEPTKEEKLSRTIPLDKVGMNTIPISLEEAIKTETPEERRIRILNNAMPTKMSDLQRQVFTYFARVPGMDTQILKAMSSTYEYAGEHTSKNGNIAIMGAVGTGKSRLSDGLVVAMCKDMGLDVAKTARVTGEKMNELDPAKTVDRMAGGFLVIENAGDMSSTTIENLNKAMEFRTDCMILIIEDEKTAMRALLAKYPEFAAKFPAVISIPVFTNDELVSFARTYCAENKCQMDELGVLALYSIISSGQSEDHPMTISEVKEIVDSAISKAKRGSRRGRKSVNKDKNIVLYEKDFA